MMKFEGMNFELLLGIIIYFEVLNLDVGCEV